MISTAPAHLLFVSVRAVWSRSSVARCILLGCSALFAIGTSGAADLSAPVVSAGINAADFSAHVKQLASDEFAGRAPASEGEDRTLAYLIAQLRRLGLSPGNGNSFTQTVPVNISRADPTHAQAQLSVGGTSHALAPGRDLLLISRNEQVQAGVQRSQLVFAGYGVSAPEHQWDDYGGDDVRGKTVLLLAGAPDFADAGRSPLERHRASYYGRTRYKFEEAARHGASAALIVHDQWTTGFAWDDLQRRMAAPQFALLASDDPAPRLVLQGWLSPDAAARLFSSAGLDFAAWRRTARRDFRARAIGDARLDIQLTSSQVRGESRNLIARLPGTRYPDEAVLYSAHWDHLGSHPDEPGDHIYHGALDNGSGVAGVLEVAAQFVARAQPPQRSVLFLIPTLEEAGLLGSEFYTRHPVVPLAATVADINFDVLLPIGPARNVVVSGLGYSDLDARLQPLVAAQGRVLGGEDAALSDSFFRSDHFSFALAGVPVLYLIGGTQSRGTSLHGKDQGELLRADYGANRYHRPADRFDPRWDLRGTMQDLQLAYHLGAALADSRDWPAWSEGTIYRSLAARLRHPATP